MIINDSVIPKFVFHLGMWSPNLLGFSLLYRKCLSAYICCNEYRCEEGIGTSHTTLPVTSNFLLSCLLTTLVIFSVLRSLDYDTDLICVTLVIIISSTVHH